ncbi:MAG: diacylglycerol kinase family protein [Pirellulales bacterium]
MSSFAELDERVERDLRAGTLRAVVAAGGDGTLNALVNRLPAETPFLMLPLGTENLVAKYLGWKPGLA